MTSKNPLTVTVVIPVFNEENHLRACLDAIAAQIDPPDEVIVVDNNSTDSTASIAKSYQFVKLINEPKQGVVYARDRGFNAAKSDLIGRIDADTIIGSEWVAGVKEFFSNPDNADHGLSGGAFFYNVRFGSAAGWLQGQVAFRVNRFLLGHYILFGSNMAIPAKNWAKVKKQVCHDLDVHEDLDLAIHWHRLGFPITYHDGLKVGIKMRRVFEERGDLWHNLLWWPKTLRRHGLKTWVIGYFGAIILFTVSLTHNLFKK